MLDTHGIIKGLRLITGTSFDAAGALPYYTLGPVYRPVMSLSNLHSTINRAALCAQKEADMANKYIRTGDMVPCRDCGSLTYVQVAKLKRGDKPLCSECKAVRAERWAQSLRNRPITCKKCDIRFYWHAQRKFCTSCTPHKSRGKQYNTSCVVCGAQFKAIDPKKKKTCSRVCQLKHATARQLGEKSHRWKGGATRPNMVMRGKKEYTQWRSAVFARDDYTCQLCFERGGKLAAHHIREYAKHPDLRLLIGNGVTLCWPCHRSIKDKERTYETTFYDITGGV